MLVKLFRAIYNIYLIKLDPVAYARKVGVRLGNSPRLIGIDSNTFGSEPYLITIGDHVTIAAQVRIITHDGGIWVFREKEETLEMVRPVCIGSNVFVGFRSIIMPGVSIGNNVVIGAGAIVASDVPDNSIVAGVPAKVIKTIQDYKIKIKPHILHNTWTNEREKREVLMRHFSLED